MDALQRVWFSLILMTWSKFTQNHHLSFLTRLSYEELW